MDEVIASETSSSVIASPPNKMLLLLGLAAAALLGLAIVSQVDPVVTMPDELGSYPIAPTAEYVIKYNKAYTHMWTVNNTIVFSIFGACLALASALLVSRTTAVTKVMMIILGAIGGAIGGGVCGYMLASAHATQGRLDVAGIPLDPMIQSVLFQTLSWGGAAIGICSALAVGCRLSLPKGIASGLLGGFLAGMIHALVGSLAFPNADISLVMPPGLVQRGIWAAYCGVSIGIGVLFLFRPSKSQVASKSVEPSAVTA